MINGKTVLAIIPARGGSKGLPGKNIKKIAGKPLIAWTIEEAKKSKYIDRVILSSDDNEIINVAKEWGCDVPFKRPEELAQDNSSSIDFILHAIESLNEKYDYMCLLQPTSPLRSVDDIDSCIKKCISNNVNSCVSVTLVDKHPFVMYEIGEEEKLISLFPNRLVNRRQDLPNVFAINGAIYVNNVEEIVKTKKIITANSLGFVMNKENSIDIDNILDLEYAEFQFAKKYNNIK